MDDPGNMAVSDEARHSWRLLSDRLARETDERLRANLDVVARHIVCEVAGDIPGLMATLVPDPQYLFVSDRESTRATGFDAVKALYERAVEKGRNRREFELALVLADRDHVVTEGALRQVMRGRDILDFDIVYDEPPLGDRWYLTEARLLIVWPLTSDGLIEGEQVYGMTERVIAEVTADMYSHLGPLERFDTPTG